MDHRYTLDLETGRVHEEPVDARFLDFPRVDERRTGLRHRLIYCVEFGGFHNGAPTTAVPWKYDLETRASTTHDHGAGRVAGEGIFVPRAGSTGEDEGYIMTYVYDARRNLSDLVVHDAADFAAPALATIRLPVRVPYGIHASWLPDSTQAPRSTRASASVRAPGVERAASLDRVGLPTPRWDRRA